MNQESYLKLISGRQSGFCASCIRFLLLFISWFYRGGIKIRNLLYTKGILKVHKFGVPVISVGNITAGGTGKTPLVIRICNLLSTRGLQVAVLTRGYKATSGVRTDKAVDEPAVLKQRCESARILLNPDRVASASKAVADYKPDVFIMDDGFQHRRLARDLDIVVVDSTQPFGFGKMFPAGLLREPVTEIKRAQAVVLTRTAQTREDELSRLESSLLSINPHLVISRSVHRPTAVFLSDRKRLATRAFTGKKVFAFCGIGNPDSFYETLSKVGCILCEKLSFPDHHNYDIDEFKGIFEAAEKHGAEFILTTEKDWTRISLLEVPTDVIAIGFLAIELGFVSGEDSIIRLIDDALAGKISQNA